MQVKLYLIVQLLLGCLCLETFAQGDLLISPNRVIFEGRKQKEELNLINTGKETTTFSVSFVQRRMNEDGSFEIIEVPDSGQMFADPYLRIYPRQVTLEPGEAQVVMLQCRRKPEMPDGEYRSHLYFRSEKNYSALGSGNSSVDTKSLSVQVIPIFGMSIPIIIHSGEVSASVALSDLKLETDDANNRILTFTINRTGNISVYGDLKVEYIPENGKPVLIGVIKGVAVYTNLYKRYVSIKLDTPADVNLKSGKLRLSYNSRDDARKQEVFAEVVHVLQ
jgi:hypothetical protein